MLRRIYSLTQLTYVDISKQEIIENFLPLILHRDEALAEVLVAKESIGEYHPHSLVVQDINALANWCMSNDFGSTK